jgi:hypothetical protein
MVGRVEEGAVSGPCSSGERFVRPPRVIIKKEEEKRKEF